MTRWIARRLGAGLVVIWVVATGTFALVSLAPGDFASRLSDPRLPPAARERWRRDFGLDRPLPARYLSWLGSAVRGDLGISWQYRRPVTALMAGALPPTLLLAGLGLLLETAGGLGIATLQVLRARSRLDRGLTLASLLAYALPAFTVALGLVWLFSYTLGWLPPSHLLSPAGEGATGWARNRDILAHAVLPVLTIGLTGMGALARYMRGSLVDEHTQGYVLAARARGCSRRRALLTHALPNALLPLITVLGLSLPFLVSGSLLVEVVFAWPGMGQLIYQAALARDIPLLMGGTLLGAAAVVAGSVLADLSVAWLDPEGTDVKRVLGIWRAWPPLLRVGAGMLGALALLVLLGPLVTGEPDAIVDPAGSAQLPPGSARVAVRLADGSTLIAETASRTAAGWAIRRLGEERLLGVAQVLDVRARRFWLGTDSLGRDVAARLLHGGRVSLTLGLLALAIATVCGVLLGLVAGWAGGAVDSVLMRLVDAVLAVPMLLLVLLLAAVLRPSLIALAVILGLASWMGVARLVRTQVMALKGRDFVLALRALGASRTRILLRHVLPNALTPLGQDAALRLGDLILLEASLGFLGFGVQPPTASWGGIMADLPGSLASGWWLLLFPGVLVACTVLGSALLAEGLQERLRHLG